MMDTTDRLMALASFFGHIQGVIDCVNKGFLPESGVCARLEELVKEYQHAAIRGVDEKIQDWVKVTKEIQDGERT